MKDDSVDWPATTIGMDLIQGTSLQDWGFPVCRAVIVFDASLLSNLEDVELADLQQRGTAFLVHTTLCGQIPTANRPCGGELQSSIQVGIPSKLNISRHPFDTVLRHPGGNCKVLGGQIVEPFASCACAPLDLVV